MRFLSNLPNTTVAKNVQAELMGKAPLGTRASSVAEVAS